MRVTVGKFPGTSKFVNVPEGATVADALRIAEQPYNAATEEVRVNGNAVDNGATVSENDDITVQARVKGA